MSSVSYHSLLQIAFAFGATFLSTFPRKFTIATNVVGLSAIHTPFVRIPERLAAHPDPSVRLFYSHWNTGQGEWAARGYVGDGTLGGLERTDELTANVAGYVSGRPAL